MARIVQVIQPTKNIGIEYLNVCAYARVSSGKDAMMHSLSATFFLLGNTFLCLLNFKTSLCILTLL